jgi:hypothetical protein
MLGDIMPSEFQSSWEYQESVMVCITSGAKTLSQYMMVGSTVLMQCVVMVLLIVKTSQYSSDRMMQLESLFRRPRLAVCAHIAITISANAVFILALLSFYSGSFWSVALSDWGTIGTGMTYGVAMLQLIVAAETSYILQDLSYSSVSCTGGLSAVLPILIVFCSYLSVNSFMVGLWTSALSKIALVCNAVGTFSCGMLLLAV